MSIEAFLRQGFIPFTQAITGQEHVLTRLIPGLRERTAKAADALRGEQRLVFVGIGASYAALGAPVAVLRAAGSDALRAGPSDFDGTDVPFALIALSQSGRSKETVDVLRRASGRRIAVVNVTESPLADEAEVVVSMGDLSDSLASTVGFSSTSIAMSMLVEQMLDEQGSEWGTLPARQAAFVRSISDLVSRLAPVFAEAAAVDVVAPSELSGAAEVTALLLREVSRIPAAAFETRQYLHGPMESTRADTVHLLLGAGDADWIHRTLAPLGRTIVHLRESEGNEGDDGMDATALPSRSVLEAPLFVAGFAQALALGIAQYRGIDPDEFLFLDTGTKLGDDE